MPSDALYDTHLKLNKEDNDYLLKIHTNKNEAIRILIRKARAGNGNNKARAILLNITIGFLALAVFYIWAIWLSWMFLFLAIFIFGFEIYDIIRSIRIWHKERKETTA